MRALAGAGLLQSTQLAVLGVWHDRAVSLCTIVGFAAMLSPLLLLFGLRFGIVDGLRRNLEADPRTRELVPLLHGSYDDAWLARLAAIPETGFVLGNTRFLASEADFAFRGAGPATAAIIPTAAGDPMVRQGGAIADNGETVALSFALALKIGAAPGSDVTMTVTRRGEAGTIETISKPLRVVEILPLASKDAQAAYVAMPLLRRIETYRGRNAETLDGPAPDNSPFPTFRLFATTIATVAALHDKVAGLGVDTRTEIATIELVLGLSRSVTALFSVISVVACGGYFVVLAMSLWATAERHEVDFATLRLLGFDPVAISAFSVVQAAVLGFLGGLCAVGVFLAAQPIVNRLFAAQALPGRSACEMEPQYLALTVGGTVLLATAASFFAAVRVAQITPAEALRHA